MPGWGQTPPAPTSEAQRPLNLSLPRDVVSPPAGLRRGETDETAERNLRKEGEIDAARTPRYGTGFEARQRGMGAEGFGGFGSGMGAPMGGGAGMGGGGRGGMGRGR